MREREREREREKERNNKNYHVNRMITKLNNKVNRIHGDDDDKKMQLSI